MDLIAAFGAGLIAGLALVVPLGAIGVLLIREGASRGFVAGMPAASAVATVDVLYCTVALAAGRVLAPTITGWAPWPQVVGGVTLIAIAAWGLIAARRRRDESALRGHEGTGAGRGPGWHRYAMLFGLTAINPATVVYFAAIATGLSSLTSSVAAAVLFVVGVATASMGWQTALVGAGAALRWKTGARAQRATAMIGNSAVALLGLFLITSAVL